MAINSKNQKRHSKIFTKGSRKKSSNLSSVNKFSVVEAYKTLRTNVQFLMNNSTSTVITFTSPLPRDGKSTVTSNLGVAFAQTSTKVVIVDCDMRNPRLNKFFNVNPSPGLSNYLANLVDLEEIFQPTEYENLHIVSSGRIPPNPAELLSSKGMIELIEILKSRFDLILLDTPPVGIVSDACVTSKYSDGTVLVIKHYSSTYAMVEKCLNSLKLVDAKVIGIVMNAVDYSKVYGKRYNKYGYSYDYKYGYGYYGSYGKNPSIDEFSGENSKGIITRPSAKED